MHGLRVGVGGCRGSRTIRGTRLFEKHPDGMKSCVILRDAGRSCCSANFTHITAASKSRFGSHQWHQWHQCSCEQTPAAEAPTSSPSLLLELPSTAATRQLATPELSNSLSIAKLLRCRLPPPSRKVGQRRSAALRTRRRFSAVIKKGCCCRDGSRRGDEDWKENFTAQEDFCLTAASYSAHTSVHLRLRGKRSSS